MGCVPSNATNNVCAAALTVRRVFAHWQSICAIVDEFEADSALRATLCMWREVLHSSAVAMCQCVRQRRNDWRCSRVGSARPRLVCASTVSISPVVNADPITRYATRATAEPERGT